MNYNPYHVPCVIIDNERRTVCKECATSVGYEIHPQAYADCTGLEMRAWIDGKNVQSM